MGLTYTFTFTASASVTGAKLRGFLKSVEADAQKMGFEPTIVFTATFSTPEQREFARRIHVLLPVQDSKLEGDIRLSQEQVVDFIPSAGRCRVVPERAEVLVITDERGRETVFGFARYPEVLKDTDGRPLVQIPEGRGWIFSNFVQSSDPRYRDIVKRFSEAGYLRSENDDYNPSPEV